MSIHTFTQRRKDKWLAALRSGEYKQGRGALVLIENERPATAEEAAAFVEERYGGGRINGRPAWRVNGDIYVEVDPVELFCCLGVYREVCGSPLSNVADDGLLITYEVDESGDALSAVRGLSKEVQDELAKMNDNGADFNIIADYIEANITAVQ